MGTIRWDPFKDLVSLQDKMNRLFESSLSKNLVTGEDVAVGAWSPPVDILESETEIILKAELPGIELDQVELNINGHILTIRGERRFSKESKPEQYHRLERFYGPFHRSFTLPNTVDKERVKAKLKDGVLEVNLPKVDAAQAKAIAISVKE